MLICAKIYNMEQNPKPDPARLENPLSLSEVLDDFFAEFPENLEKLQAEQRARTEQATDTEVAHAVHDSVQEFREVTRRIEAGESHPGDSDRKEQLRKEIWAQQQNVLNSDE